MAKAKKYSVTFRIWFFEEGEKLIGKGRVELLERIQNTGSISQAAKQMKMSYRQAWQMIQEMNERASAPFVEKQVGGNQGGGTTVTQAGLRAIENFHELEHKVAAFINLESKKLKF